MNRTLLALPALLMAACIPAGGNWIPSGRLDTAHLQLLTGRTPEATRRVAELLERGIQAYRDRYGKTWDLKTEPPRLTVYLFADRNAFVRAGAQVVPEMDLKGVTGFYAYDSRSLYVGSRGGGTEEAVALHELTHALDHQWARRVPDEGPDALPPWLLEGRSDHLAYSLAPPGRGLAKALRQALAEQDLDRLTRLDAKDFLKEAYSNYALAWAFVAFLEEADGGRRAPAFHRFLDGMPRHCGKAELEKFLGPMTALEGEFRDYAEQELLPALRSGNPGRRRP